MLTSTGQFVIYFVGALRDAPLKKIRGMNADCISQDRQTGHKLHQEVLKVKMSPCVIKYRAKKAYGGIQTQLHTLVKPIYMQVIASFELPRPRSLYPQLRGAWYTLNTRLGGPTAGPV